MEAPDKAPRGRPSGSRQGEIKSDGVFRVRSALKMTQEEFAREMETSIATIRRYEQNKLLPAGIAQKSAFARIAKKAGVEVEEESA